MVCEALEKGPQKQDCEPGAGLFELLLVNKPSTADWILKEEWQIIGSIFKMLYMSKEHDLEAASHTI